LRTFGTAEQRRIDPIDGSGGANRRHRLAQGATEDGAGIRDQMPAIRKPSCVRRRKIGRLPETDATIPRDPIRWRVAPIAASSLVCLLTFVLSKTLEMWQRRAGIGNSPRTILEECARVRSHDLVPPISPRGISSCAASPAR
jgi:hypothetical protein